MDMSGEHRIEASREQVWQALNDPEVLKACIPGCDSLEKLTDTQFAATVTAKVGPVKAKFKGEVELSDIDPPNGYTISGEGKGGAAGFAKGGAKVKLTEDDGATLLGYEVNANVGGKMAQLGSRLIDGTAKKLSDEFFQKFAEMAEAAAPEEAPIIEAPVEEPVIEGPVEQPATPEPETAPSPEPAPVQEPAAGGGLPSWVWITGLIVVVAVILWLVTGS